ncbi:hypothetical protein Pla123a_37340 [Posidoniimonas polymericola]|uniref:Uncharacterized protein n=2 Tax=Posidoniimonas polymericola TaxID=2528002 RepID=A0A5C5YES4_9BACT|nr:hypothetical protein Pla123a_37340 [Posidoniimonas polymericola]
MVTIALAVFATTAAAKTELLKHDDGSQEGKRSMTGGMHSVRFECPEGEWRLTGIRLHGSRYGAGQAPNEDFLVLVTNEDHSQQIEIKQPYSLFERGPEKWVRINFDPVAVSGAFHVAVFFNPTRTKGVYVGIDEGSSANSFVRTASDPSAAGDKLDGEWMIRAYLTDDTAGAARRLMTNEQRTEQQADREQSIERELLGDARSLTLKHDDGPTDDHMNIQGACYTVGYETPKNVEAYVWQVQIYASQFGREHDSEAVSGDVYVLDQDRNILSRTTFPYSVATQRKDWISIPTLPTKVQGRFYVSVDAHGKNNKGLYLGYRDDPEQTVASSDSREGDAIRPAEWSGRFSNMQWLIRVKVADRPVVYPGP